MEEINSRDKEFLESLIGIIISNLSNENFGANELAKEKCMSQRKLSRRLSSVTNKSISQFIRETRLQKALELLREEDVTVAEVAYKVGFGSATYFNKCFHEFFGVPPGRIGKEGLPGIGESASPEEEQVYLPVSSVKHLVIKVFAGLFILSCLIIIAAYIFDKNSTTGNSSINEKNQEKALSLQKELEQIIAAELRAGVTYEEKQLIEESPTPDLTALDLMQQGALELGKLAWPLYDEALVKRAERFFRKSLEYDNTYPPAYLGLGWVYEYRVSRDRKISDNDVYNRYMDSVLILADIALSFNKHLSEPHYLKGIIFRRKGNNTKAIAELEKAVKCNPKYWGPYHQLALCYDDIVKRIEFLQKSALVVSMNHDPGLSWHLKILGNQYYNNGFPEKGDHYFLEALKLDGDSVNYSENTANRLTWTCGKYQKAHDHYEKRYLEDSLNASTTMMLGFYYMLAGRHKEALRLYNKYISDLNGNELFKFSTDKIYRAELLIPYVYMKNGYRKEAIEYCDRIIEANNNLSEHSPGLIDNYSIASAFALKGDKANALKHLKDLPRWMPIDLCFLNMIKNDPMLDNIRDEPDFVRIAGEFETEYREAHERMKRWIAEHE